MRVPTGGNKGFLGGIAGVVVLLFIFGILLWEPADPGTIAGSQEEPEEAYKIGAIIPITGDAASIGIPLANGLQLAVDEVNAEGGINGHEVELNLQDSKYDGKTSVASAQYLLDVFGPDIVTVLFGIPAESVSPILTEAKIPWMFETFASSPLRSSDYVFKGAYFDMNSGCRELISYARENELYQQVGILSADAEWAHLCIEGLKEIEPNVKEYYYHEGDRDFQSFLTRANQDGVDRVLMLGFENDFVNMFGQLSKLGYPIKLMCITASECITPKILESVSRETLDGMLSVDFIPLDLEEHEFGKKFIEKHEGASGAQLNFGALGYEEGMIITKAMAECVPGEHECLRNALKGVRDYESVIGSNGFNEDRILEMDLKRLQYDGDDGWQEV